MKSLSRVGMSDVVDSSAPAMESFEDLLNEFTCVTAKQNTVVFGTLTSQGKTGFGVEIGGKSEAFVMFEDVGEGKLGDNLGFIVLGAAAPFGRVGEFDETAVRLSHVRYLEVEQLNAMQNKGEVGYAYVTGVNKNASGIEAGLDVEIFGIAGFVPSREVEKRPENGMGRLWNFIGKTVPVKVLPPDNKRRRANSKTMFSHAAAMLSCPSVRRSARYRPRGRRHGGSSLVLQERRPVERSSEGRCREAHGYRQRLRAEGAGVVYARC